MPYLRSKITDSEFTSDSAAIHQNHEPDPRTAFCASAIDISEPPIVSFGGADCITAGALSTAAVSAALDSVTRFSNGPCGTLSFNAQMPQVRPSFGQLTCSAR
jgi:hypothetical protein